MKKVISILQSKHLITLMVSFIGNTYAPHIVAWLLSSSRIPYVYTAVPWNINCAVIKMSLDGNYIQVNITLEMVNNTACPGNVVPGMIISQRVIYWCSTRWTVPSTPHARRRIEKSSPSYRIAVCVVHSHIHWQCESGLDQIRKIEMADQRKLRNKTCSWHHES